MSHEAQIIAPQAKGSSVPVPFIDELQKKHCKQWVFPGAQLKE